MSWYYRPEEARGGRKAFHGDKELFTSDHYDWVAKSSINGHCSVHKLREYQQLTEVTDNDYYTRFSYKASKGGVQTRQGAGVLRLRDALQPRPVHGRVRVVRGVVPPAVRRYHEEAGGEAGALRVPERDKKAQAQEAKKQRVK